MVRFGKDAIAQDAIAQDAKPGRRQRCVILPEQLAFRETFCTGAKACRPLAS